MTGKNRFLAQNKTGCIRQNMRRVLRNAHLKISKGYYLNIKEATPVKRKKSFKLHVLESVDINSPKYTSQ